jgi:hypothetical protein
MLRLARGCVSGALAGQLDAVVETNSLMSRPTRAGSPVGPATAGRYVSSLNVRSSTLFSSAVGTVGHDGNPAAALEDGVSDLLE